MVTSRPTKMFSRLDLDPRRSLAINIHYGLTDRLLYFADGFYITQSGIPK